MKDYKDVFFLESFILRWLLHHTYILPEHLWKKDFYAPAWADNYSTRELSFLFVHRDDCSIFSEEYTRRGKYTNTCTFNFHYNAEKKLYLLSIFNGVNSIEFSSQHYGFLLEDNKDTIITLMNDWVTCGGVVKPPVKCPLCHHEIKGYGHNGEPIVSGKVCDDCSAEVIKSRLKLSKEVPNELK